MALVNPLLKRWKRRVLDGLAVHFFGRLILPLLVKTWSVETDFPAEWLARAQQGERVILAFWHNRQLGFLRLVSVLQPASVLVSRHGDGEIIARIVSRFGVGAVRGSSTRGGTGALRQMVAASRETNVAITPDGPLGPCYEVKDGVIALAAMSGLPVFWVCWSTDRAWIFDSWDRFMLPKPFAKLHVQARGPLFVDRDASAEELEQARHALEHSMRQQTALLDERSGQIVNSMLTAS